MISIIRWLPESGLRFYAGRYRQPTTRELIKLSPESPNLAWALRDKYHFLSKKDIQIAAGASKKDVDTWLRKRNVKIHKKHRERLLLLRDILEVFDDCTDEVLTHTWIRSMRVPIGLGRGERVLGQARFAASEYRKAQAKLDARSEEEGP